MPYVTLCYKVNVTFLNPKFNQIRLEIAALLLKDIPLDKGFRGVSVGRTARIETSKEENVGKCQEFEDKNEADTARLRVKQDWERNRASVDADREVNVVNYRKTRPPERR